MPRVKRVTMEDAAILAAIEGIEAEVFSDPWSLQSIENSVCGLRTRVYAALDDADTLMGYLFLTQVMDVADVDNIAVAPAFRRQGVASLLLETALDGMDAEVFLEVRASNAPAIALYQKFGFTQCGIRRNYYEKPREDALLMKRERDPHP